MPLDAYKKKSFVQYTPQTDFALSKMIKIVGLGAIMNGKHHLTYGFMLLWCIASMVLPVSAAAQDATDGSMMPTERKYLLDQLKSSEAGLLDAIQSVTQAQWTFKPSPGAWSIQECAEHLILAEDLIFNEAQKVLVTPPVARLSNATPEGDRQVVAQMENRTTKAKAPKVLQPTDKFPTPEDAAREFKLRREKTIAYVESTKDPLRIHAGDGPAGPRADVYQFLLELAAHSVRHTAQIREVQLAPGYPKS
jgi:hypothetical protein